MRKIIEMHYERETNGFRINVTKLILQLAFAPLTAWVDLSHGIVRSVNALHKVTQFRLCIEDLLCFRLSEIFPNVHCIQSEFVVLQNVDVLNEQTKKTSTIKYDFFYHFFLNIVAQRDHIVLHHWYWRNDWKSDHCSHLIHLKYF